MLRTLFSNRHVPCAVSRDSTLTNISGLHWRGDRSNEQSEKYGLFSPQSSKSGTAGTAGRCVFVTNQHWWEKDLNIFEHAHQSWHECYETHFIYIVSNLWNYEEKSWHIEIWIWFSQRGMDALTQIKDSSCHGFKNERNGDAIYVCVYIYIYIGTLGYNNVYFVFTFLNRIYAHNMWLLPSVSSWHVICCFVSPYSSILILNCDVVLSTLIV